MSTRYRDNEYKWKVKIALDPPMCIHLSSFVDGLKFGLLQAVPDAAGADEARAKAVELTQEDLSTTGLDFR